MPWCEDCDKFWNPNSLAPDGTCPSCGRQVGEPPEQHKVPWHFWVIIIAFSIYMGWRIIQGIQWLLSR